MLTARFPLLLALLVALLGHSGAARAEGGAAAAAFDEGLGHYRRKAFSEAAESFFRAYRLKPSADAAFNAGLAWQLAGRSALAATAYEVALAQGLGGSAASDARARLAELTPELGRIEVSAPKGSKVRAPPFVLDAIHAAFFLEPGPSQVSITLRDGTPRVRRIEAVAGKTTVVLVEETEPERPERHRPAGSPAPDSSPSSLQTMGWVSLGVAAAAAGAAAYLGVRALGARDDYNDSGHRDAAARERAENLRTATNVAWVVAGVAAAAGVGLLVIAPADTSGPAAFRGIALGGRF